MNYQELLKLDPSPGQAFALRVQSHALDELLAGRVAAVDLEECPEPGHRPVKLDVDTYTVPAAPEGRGRDWVTDLPPVHGLGTEPSRGAPPVEIVYRAEQDLGVCIPDPVFRGGGRVVHYDTRPTDTFAELLVGEVVNPRDALPAEHHPEVSL